MSRSGKKTKKGSKKASPSRKTNNKAENQPKIDETSKNDEKSVIEKVSDTIEKSEVNSETDNSMKNAISAESAEKAVDETISEKSKETVSEEAEVKDIGKSSAEETSVNSEAVRTEEETESTAEEEAETEKTEETSETAGAEESTENAVESAEEEAETEKSEETSETAEAEESSEEATEPEEISEKPVFGEEDEETENAAQGAEESVYEDEISEEAEEAEDPDAYIDADIELSIDMIPTANYALQQNGLELIKSIIIKNKKNEPIKDIELVITSADELCLPFMMHIEYITENSDFEIKHTTLRLNGEKLVSLTEKVKGSILFELTKNGKTISRNTKEIDVLAYDECTGFNIYPELLCSFVTPNHPEIVGIISKASSLLEEWTGDPSFTGYQSCDPNIALKQAAAIYGAIEAQNIVYSEPPASFEASGQRIRLCDSIMSQKLGTCMDMTLLYASALELVGLHPLLIMKKGHIFAGLWLEDMTFPEAVQDDPALLRKKLADGVNEIAVVECTLMNAGKGASFDDASQAAVKEVPEALCIIDVKRSRYSGIKPLPVRVMTDSGWTVQRDGKEDDEITGIPKELDSVISIDESKTAPLTKLQQWERKLLDLGLRNSLINFRMSKTTVPLIISSVDDLEDALADGEDFIVMPRPEELKLSGNIGFESIDDIGECSEIIKSEFKNHRLRSLFSETELANTIKEIYRSSKVVISLLVK